jgi:beta-mannosidase
MEEREWWYRLSFDGPQEPSGPDERLLLIFHGLDTFATIWLNGEELGRHRNMFREAVFDVGGRVRPGEPNTLALCFDRPFDHAGEQLPDQWGRNPERAAIRKAQFGFGWDWGPRLPTIGIWRPVELRRERRAAIRGVHFSTLEIDSTGKQALVAVHIEVERFATDGPLSTAITLATGGDASPSTSSPSMATVPSSPPRLTWS